MCHDNLISVVHLLTSKLQHRAFVASRSKRLAKQASWLLVIAIIAVNSRFWSPSDCAAQVPQKAEQGGMPKGYEKVVAVSLDGIVTRTDTLGSLLRELARQGLLISAEEELGLPTLDRAIGELIPTGNAAPGPYQVTIVGFTKSESKNSDPFAVVPYDFTLTISRRELSGQPFTWASPQMPVPDQNWYEPLVEQVEAMSRGAFVEVLQKGGFQKSNRKSASGTRPGAKPENRLDVISQFALTRYLHAQIATDGESPEALAGLARSYSNLGSLTDFHWSPASKGFKARGLLYAQRLVSKYGPSPFSLAHRAYARALAGRHAAALEAVAAARVAKGDAAPSWLDLIQAYCEFKPTSLEQAKGSDHELALYLRSGLVDLENEKVRSLEVLQKFLTTNPACSRAADMLADMPALGVMRGVTEVGFNEMWPHLYQRSAAIPDLPAAAKKIADAAKGRKMDPRTENSRRKELLVALQSAGGIKDHAGPSWVVLADLLRDISFAQAYRILHVEVDALGVNADGTIQRLKPLVQGHPFEKFLEGFGSDKRAAMAALANLGTAIDKNLLEPTAIPLTIEMYERLDSREGDKVAFKIITNTDQIYEDAIRAQTSLVSLPDKGNLFRISPHSPKAIANEIKRNPNLPLAEWEEKYGGNVVVLMALFRRYEADHRSSDALRCLQKAVDISPSCSTYLELSKLHVALGQRDLWQADLEKALKLPSLGLEHAQIHSELADWLMRQGKWKQAKSHALEAAESFSAFGLLSASHYSEGIENWVDAERYQQLVSTRYENLADNWYLWCVRTGRGKSKEARTLAERHWKSLVQPLDSGKKWRLATAHLLNGKRDEAIALLRELLRDDRDGAAGIYAAVLADEAAANAVRDELFREIETTLPSNNPVLDLASCFQNLMAGKEQGRWDPLVFELLVYNSHEDSVPYLYLAAGQFLGKHGQKELSKEYLQTAATPFRVESVAAVVAADLLRKQKVTVGKARTSNLPDALAPLAEQVANARFAQKRGEYDEAVASLTKVLKTRGDFLPALAIRASVYQSQKKFAEAIADLEMMVSKSPNSYHGYTRLAKLLATCEKSELRNGPKALENAKRGSDLRPFQTRDSVSTLAMAHAECGQFDKAIELEKRAATMPGDESASRERLASYLANKPYRPRPKTVSTGGHGEPGLVRSWQGNLGRSQFGVFSQDGQRVVFGAGNDIIVADALSGANAVKFSGHTKGVWMARFSEDGQRIVSASHDATIRLWDPSTQKQLSEISLKNVEPGTLLSAAKNGTQIAYSCRGDLDLALINGVTKSEVRRIGLTEKEVWWRSITPDCTWGLSNGIRNESKVWNLATGTSFELNNGHHNYCGQFTHDGQRVLLAGAFTWDFWDLQRKAKVKEGKVTGGHIYAVATSPNGGRFMTGLADNSIWLWDESASKELLIFRGHEKSVAAISMSPDDRLAISQDHAGVINLWRLPTIPGSREELP